jgi:hypothetical protein
MLTWLSDTAGNLRDSATLLRGGTPAPPWGSGIPTQEDIDAYQEMLDADPHAPFDVIGQSNIDSFLALARQDELSPEEMDEMRSYLGAFSDDPNFAAAVVDQMGMEEFLALSRRVEGSDSEEAQGLRDELARVMTAAFWVPGNMRPGTDEYDEWTENNTQGQAYLARLQALQGASEENTAEAADLVNNLINDEDLGLSELNALNEFLRNNAQSGDFNRALMSEISPEGLVTLAERLPDWARNGEEDLRGGYADLQTNIANSLANATDVGRPQSGDPTYPHWENTSQAQWYLDFMADFEAAGRSEVDVGFTDGSPFNVYGYQMLVNLMDSGNGYSTGFLTDVADDVRDFEETSDDESLWQAQTDSAGVDGIAIDEMYRLTLDPMNGLMGIMGRHPDSATTWLDPENGDNLDYMINDREWNATLSTWVAGYNYGDYHTVVPADRSGFGYALEAATTGHVAGSDQPFNRTEAGDRVMHDAVEAFSGDQGALIADDGPWVSIRSQLGNASVPFIEEFQYTIGDHANLLHAEGDDVPNLFGGNSGDMPVDMFLSQVSRNPEGYAAITGANEAFTTLVVDVSMNDHSRSGVDIGERLENDTAPGISIAGILSHSRASATFDAEIADDAAFNQNVDIAETAAGLLIGEGVGLLTSKLPVGGDVIGWGVEELQSSIFDSMRRDTSDEAYADADDEYWAGREAMGNTIRNAIDVAGEDYVPQQPNEDVNATLEDLKLGVGENVNSHWNDEHHWTEPPEEPE